MLPQLIALSALGGGGWYFWKRKNGHIAPPVAPIAPPHPLQSPTVTQSATSTGPNVVLAAITGGDTSNMTPAQAQTAINAANAAGAYASSDLGNAAGADTTSFDPTSAPLDDSGL